MMKLNITNSNTTIFENDTATIIYNQPKTVLIKLDNDDTLVYNEVIRINIIDNRIAEINMLKDSVIIDTEDFEYTVYGMPFIESVCAL